jgi:alpha-tubulin suppressor-like RCC1 family protein
MKTFLQIFVIAFAIIIVGCKQQLQSKQDKAQVVDLNGNFDGCVSAEATGIDRIKVTFSFPPDSSAMYIYRDGVPISPIFDKTQTIVTDVGLNEGQTYKYSCYAQIGKTLFQGRKVVEATTFAVNAPVFSGIKTVVEPSTSISLKANTKKVLVTWEPASGGAKVYTYKLYAVPGKTVDFSNLPAPKLLIDPSSTSTELTAIGEDVYYSFFMKACTKGSDTVTEKCDTNTNIIKLRISDGGAPSTYLTNDMYASAKQINGSILLTMPWVDTQGGVYSRKIVRVAKNADGTTTTKEFAAIVSGSGDYEGSPTPMLTFQDTDILGYAEYWYTVQDADPTDNSKVKVSNSIYIKSGDITPPTFGGLSSIVFKAGAEDTTVTLNWTRIDQEDALHINGASFYQIYQTSTNSPTILPKNPCTDSSAVLSEVALTSNLVYTNGGDNPTDAHFDVSGLLPRNHYAFCVKARDAAGNISTGITYNEGSGTSAIPGHRAIMRDITAPLFNGAIAIGILPGQKLHLGWDLASDGHGGAANDLKEYKIKLMYGMSSDGDVKTNISQIRNTSYLATTDNKLGLDITKGQQGSCTNVIDNSVTTCRLFGDNELLGAVVDVCDDAATNGVHDFSVGQTGVSNCSAVNTTSYGFKNNMNFVKINDLTPPQDWGGLASAAVDTTKDGTVNISWTLPLNKPASMPDYNGFIIYRIINSDPLLPIDTLNDPKNKEVIKSLKCVDLPGACTTSPISYVVTGLDAYRTYYFYASAFDAADPANEALSNISVGSNTWPARTADVTAPWWGASPLGTQDAHINAALQNGQIQAVFDLASDNQYAFEPGALFNYSLWVNRTDSTVNTISYDPVYFANSANWPTLMLSGWQNLNLPADQRITFNANATYAGNGTNIIRSGNTLTYSFSPQITDQNKNLFFITCANDASLNTRCSTNFAKVKIDDVLPPEVHEVAYEVKRTDNDPNDKVYKSWRLKVRADDASLINMTVRRVFADTTNDADFPSQSDPSNLLGSFSASNIEKDPSYHYTAYDNILNDKDSGGIQLNHLYANYLISFKDSSPTANETLYKYSVVVHYPVEIASGGSHHCSRFSSGKVFCWGSNTYGQLGYPNMQATSLPINHDYGFVSLGNKKAIQIVAGTNHTCALLEDKSVRCWGDGSLGQLGNARSGSLNTIGITSFPDDKPTVKILDTDESAWYVSKIFAYSSTTCAQITDGTNKKIRCWGTNYNVSYTTGNNSGTANYYRPLDTKAMSPTINYDVDSVTTGEAQTCLTAKPTSGNRQLYCVGGNANYVWDGSTVGTWTQWNQSKLDAIGSIVKFGVGAYQACGLFNISGVNKVACWGQNNQSLYEGVLGSNLITTQSIYISTWFGSYWNPGVAPATLTNVSANTGGKYARLGFGTGETIKDLVVGSDRNCMISDSGKIKCWGGLNTGMPGGNGTNYYLGWSRQIIYSDTTGTQGALTTCSPTNPYGSEPALADATSANCLKPKTPALTTYSVETVPQTINLNPNGTDNDKAVSLAIGGTESCAILNHGDISCFGGATYSTKSNYFQVKGNHAPVFSGFNVADINIEMNTDDWQNIYLVSAIDSDKGDTLVYRIKTMPAGGRLQCQNSSGVWSNITAVGDTISSPYICRYKVSNNDGDPGVLVYNGNYSFSYEVVDSSGASISKKVNLKNDLPDIANYKTLQLALGDNHGCVLYQNLTTQKTNIRCWGDGTYGQLGYGNKAIVGTSRTISYSSATDLIYNNYSTDVNRSNYLTRYFATNNDYFTVLKQLQDETSTLRYGQWFKTGEFGDVPVFWDPKSMGLVDVNIVKLTAGYNHTCAMVEKKVAGVLSGYQTKCWGRNQKNQLLGYANTNDNIGDEGSADVPFYKGNTADVLDVEAGGDTTCILTNESDPKIKCYGNLNFTTAQSTLGGTVSKMAIGDTHMCVLLNTGAVRCRGSDNHGQIGNGGAGQTDALLNFDNPLSLGAIDLVAGKNNNCALLSNRTVSCWGGDTITIGGSDDGSTDIQSPGTGFKLSDNKDIVSLTSGYTSASTSTRTCGILVGGSARCWGYNTNYSLGYPLANGLSNVKYPDLLPEISSANLGEGITNIKAGGTFGCFLTSSSKMNCYGDNSYGQLARNNSDISNTYNGAAQIAQTLSTRVNHPPFFALLEKDDYAIVALMDVVKPINLVRGYDLDWDDNDTLQYTITNPALVTNGLTKCLSKPGSTGATDLSCEYLYPNQAPGPSLAPGPETFIYKITDGINPQMQKSVNITLNDSLPRYFDTIVSGFYHSCAIYSDHKDIMCWGYNGYGQLGMGNTISSNTGTATGVGVYGSVPLLSVAEKTAHPNYTIEDVTVGTNHSCALIRYGSRNAGDPGLVRCWGKNDLKQLGMQVNAGSNIGDDEMAFKSPAVLLKQSGFDVNPLRISTAGNRTCSIGAFNNGTSTLRAVQCWGTNQAAWETMDAKVQLYYLQTQTSDPQPVDVSVSLTHVCVGFSNGNISCFGDNSRGELGINNTINSTDILNLTIDTTKKAQLSATEKMRIGWKNSDATSDYRIANTGNLLTGNTFSCAILKDSTDSPQTITDGMVKCWGNKTYLGFQLQSTGGVNTDCDVGSASSGYCTVVQGAYVNLSAAAVKFNSTLGNPCAQLSNGQVQCWAGTSTASNGVQLGYGAGALGVNVVSFSYGAAQQCYVLDNYNLKCIGTKTNSTLPSGYCLLSDSACAMGTAPSQISDLNISQTQVSAPYNPANINIPSNHAPFFSASSEEIFIDPTTTSYKVETAKDYDVYDRLTYTKSGSGAGCVTTMSPTSEDVVSSLNYLSLTLSTGAGCNTAFTFNLTATDLAGALFTKSITVKRTNQKISQVVLGENHTCALVKDATNSLNNFVKCWGDNTYGQLGHNVDSIANQPYQLPALAIINSGTEPTKYVEKISASGQRTCALIYATDDVNYSGIRCWGRGSSSSAFTPGNGVNASVQTVSFPYAQNYLNPASTLNYTNLASESTLSLFTNGYGAMTDVKTLPIADLNLGANVKILDIAAGPFHTCIVYEDTVSTLKSSRCWGLNNDGRLGRSTTSGTVDSLGDVAGYSYSTTSWSAPYYAGSYYYTSCSFNYLPRTNEAPSINSPRMKYKHTISSVDYETVCIDSSKNCTDVNMLDYSNQKSIVSFVSGKICRFNSGNSTWEQLTNTPSAGTAQVTASIGFASGLYGTDTNLHYALPANQANNNLGGDEPLNIYAGGNHTCVHSADNSVSCWGQIPIEPSNSSFAKKDSPTKKSSWGFPDEVAAGYATTCVRSGPNVNCYGTNQAYVDIQYEPQDNINQITPYCAKITDASGNDAVKCWGRQLGFYSYQATTTACSYLYDATCWMSFYNNLGINEMEKNYNLSPYTNYGVVNPIYTNAYSPTFINEWDVKLSQSSPAVDLLKTPKEKVSFVASSPNGDASCAVIDDRRLRCWGNNRQGQLGYATNSGIEQTTNKTPRQRGDVILLTP